MYKRMLKYVVRRNSLSYFHMANKSRTTKPRFSVNVMSKRNSKIQPQRYNYFLVLDFEATCLRGRGLHPQEIIEFPVLKVNSLTFEVESTFHQYVEPQVHSELSPFCTELTGIIQEMVDGQPNINETLEKFENWMKNEGLRNPSVASIFVTCGDWDLRTMLPNQSEYFQLPYPNYLKHWINIKKPFCEVCGIYPRDMMTMLNHLKIEHEGQHHSGIDDCRNIAKILKELAQRGYVFKETGTLPEIKPT